jgi:Ca2+-binding RTX toxin-like protein
MAILNAQQAVNTRDLPELEPIIGDMAPDPVTGDGTISHGPNGINYKFGNNEIDIDPVTTFEFAGAQNTGVGEIGQIAVEINGSAAYTIMGLNYVLGTLWADNSDGSPMSSTPATIFAGDDTLNGSAFDDILFAFAGADVINGNNGDDEMNGGDGDDVMTGGAGNDEMNGGDGDDVMTGGDGDDEMNGGVGVDELTGGNGADEQTGGDGADTFFFLSILESTKKASGRDTILDFDRIEGDEIHLTAIDAKKGNGNQDFKFIKKQDFHDKKGELRYKVKDSDAYLEGDTDGNGKADFVVVFDGVSKLKEADFEL